MTSSDSSGNTLSTVSDAYAAEKDYYSTSEGWKAANQMLKMTPAGITILRICLHTVSDLCLHFAPKERILISKRHGSHSGVKENADFQTEDTTVCLYWQE